MGIGDVLIIVLFGLMFLVMLSVSTLYIRVEHAHHVHTLWYLCFLSACLYSGVLLYLYSTSSLSSGSFFVELFTSTMNMLMDGHGELKFVAGILIVGIIPQCLSFIISGLFGCGSPPILVSTITKLAIFGFIKLYCVLAGIYIGQSVVKYYITSHVYAEHGTLYEGLSKTSIPLMLFKSFTLIAISFFFSALYYNRDNVYLLIAEGLRLKYLYWLWKYMTRYAEN